MDRKETPLTAAEVESWKIKRVLYETSDFCQDIHQKFDFL